MEGRTRIEHVQPHSIVRLADGRLGVAPNRSNRGAYHVLVARDRSAVLHAGDEVELVQLSVDVAMQRMTALLLQEIGQGLRLAGCSVGELAPDYGQFVVTVQRANGSTYDAYFALDVQHGRVRALLDYDGWQPVALTADAILQHIEQEQIETTRRMWPDAPQYHAVRILREGAAA